MGRANPKPLARLRGPVAPVRETLLVGLAILGLCSGCTKNILSPAAIPAEFQAPPAQCVNRIDLSRLAQYAVNSQRIERGDILEVSIIVDSQAIEPITAPVRVQEDGQGNVPQIGRVDLAGLELEEAEQAITAAAIGRNLYRDPHITVTMKQQRMNRVTVIGAVTQEGVHELPRGSSTLLAALVAAGPLTEDASPDIEIRHASGARTTPGVPSPVQPRVAGGAPGQLASFQPASLRPMQTVHINLISATQHENVNHELNDGDVIMVAKQPPRTFHVLGLVQKPGSQELPPDQELRVLDAIAAAGGVNSMVADDVLIIRRGPDKQEPIKIQTSIDKAKLDDTANVRLAPGDIVSVEQTPTTFVWDVLRNVVRLGIGGSVSLF